MGNNVRGINRDLRRWLETLSGRIKGSAFANHPLVLLVIRVVRDLNRDDGTHMAAGVAYYAFISLFPLVLGLVALGGVVLGSAEGLQERLLEFIADYIPGSSELVSDNVDTVVRYSTPLGIASFVGLFWTASAVFGAITRAVNRAWGVRLHRPARPRRPALLPQQAQTNVDGLVPGAAFPGLDGP